MRHCCFVCPAHSCCLPDCDRPRFFCWCMVFSSPLPAPWCDSLNGMQKMLVLKVFREEKVLFAIKEFVKNHLGVNFIQSPPTTMTDIHGDSDPSTPIIFILSVGTTR